jgi:hypothetical protein
MKVKTKELIGPALDWAVAKCEGIEWENGDLDAAEYGPGFRPSVDWSHGGPIIEQERIEIRGDGDDGWLADDYIHEVKKGATPLIAAMRCYVASKIGDEVEIPEELIK